MKIRLSILPLLAVCTCFLSTAFARPIEYNDREEKVYVTPNEPTVVSFPDDVSGGFKANSTLHMEKRGRDLIIIADKTLRPEGEVIIVYLERRERPYVLRVLRAAGEK